MNVFPTRLNMKGNLSSTHQKYQSTTSRNIRRGTTVSVYVAFAEVHFVHIKSNDRGEECETSRLAGPSKEVPSRLKNGGLNNDGKLWTSS